MARLVAALLAASQTMAASVPPAWVSKEFRAWTAKHGKRYDSDVDWRRSAVAYDANADTIRDLNGDGADSAEYGHTIFSDLSPVEFARQRLPHKMDAARGRHGGSLRVGRLYFDDPPETIDWRSEGAMTPVRDQQACGSCWAEAAVTNIESHWFLANKQTMDAPVALSIQQVIECDPHDNACYGGFPNGAYQYVIEHGGLTSEENYPYTATGHTICLANQTFNATCGDGLCDDPPLTNSCDETCSDKAASHKSVAQIKSWTALPVDEGAIAVYLAQHGPIAAGIDASGGLIGVLFPWLQFYKRGIANPRYCTATIDHGVVLVGYGEEDGQKYWAIRNSWGVKWGEAGYFRLLRDAAKCGIATMATSAVVESKGAAVVVV